ncbi:MAG: peptidylprolyl isomerase [Pontimonas sp.]
MNKVFTIVSTVALVGGLLGCASDTEVLDEGAAGSALAEGCTPSGDQIETISFSGVLGASPEVLFEAPLEVDATQRSVILEGEGVVVADGDHPLIDNALYNAATGELIEESGYNETSPTPLTLDTNVATFVGVSLTAACSTVGSRVAGLIPPLDAFGLEGAPEFGLGAGEALLFVMDIIEVKPPSVPPLEELEGDAIPGPEGFPLVDYAANGEPTVTLPEGDIPSEFALATVLVGDGPLVADGDVVVVHYHGVNWNTDDVFDSSWGRGEPAAFPAGGVIPGFRDGLVGQTVGSRVIIIIPPELAYGPTGGTQDGSIGAEDTIVFVVDILGVE